MTFTKMGPSVWLIFIILVQRNHTEKESLLPSGQECEIYTELRFYLITNLYAQDEVIHSILDFKAEFPISILVDFD